MSRPKNKTELLELSDQYFNRLIDYVKSLNSVELSAEFPKQYMNRNVRDVLAHLHHWHLMFLDWYKTGMAGNKPDIPAKGYTWKDTPQLNKVINTMYCHSDIKEIRKKLKSSHDKVQALIHKHSNDELFEKKRYKWTGSTSLGAYLVSTTSSHYDWAYKLIKKCKK